MINNKKYRVIFVKCTDAAITTTVLKCRNELPDNQVVKWLSAMLSICDRELRANNSLITKKQPILSTVSNCINISQKVN